MWEARENRVWFSSLSVVRHFHSVFFACLAAAKEGAVEVDPSTVVSVGVDFDQAAASISSYDIAVLALAFTGANHTRGWSTPPFIWTPAKQTI